MLALGKHDALERIVILTSNPTHQDVVYFAELGVNKVITIANRPYVLDNARKDFHHHINRLKKEINVDPLHAIYKGIDALIQKDDAHGLVQLEQLFLDLDKSLVPKDSAKDRDIQASFAFIRKDYETAGKLWDDAIQKNPNFYRAYNNLIQCYIAKKDYQLAIELLRKMNAINNNNISRTLILGVVHLRRKERAHAQHHFQNAYEKDPFCYKALNALAEIYFGEDQLQESHACLVKSMLKSQMGSKLNIKGVRLLEKGEIALALVHYEKASYVLREQERSHLIFYNIGLCLVKMHQFKEAKGFLVLSYIKHPKFEKTKKLLVMLKKAASPQTKS